MAAEHGTVKRYAQGCTCDRCSEAAAPWQERWAEAERTTLTVDERRRRSTLRQRLRRRALREAAAAGTIEVPHGRQGNLTYGCHCDLCVQAARQYQREYRARRRTG